MEALAVLVAAELESSTRQHLTGRAFHLGWPTFGVEKLRMNFPTQSRHVTKEEVQDSIIADADDIVGGSSATGAEEAMPGISQKRAKPSAGESKRPKHSPVIGLT